jgi:hypothetical protein
MTTTAGSMIQDALEMIQVYAPGEPMIDPDAQRCLGVLNKMMDSWSNESLTCVSILEQAIPLQVNKQSYTIGTMYGIGSLLIGTSGIGQTPDINLTRPLRLLDGPGTAFILDTNGNRYGVDVVPRDKWNLIGSPQADTNIPSVVFYDPQFPLGVINVFPVPNQPYTLYVDSLLPLTDFPSLTASLNMPPGYEDAIVSNLAIRCKPYFPGQISPSDWNVILDLARVSKANVKRTNMRVNEAVFDPEIISRASYVYNIYTDRGGGLT